MEDVATFDSCIMQRVTLNNAVDKLLYFKNCDLRWSTFMNSNLQDFKFINCDLRGVCFDCSDLTGVDFSGSKIDSSTSFSGCELRHVTGLDESKISANGGNVISIISKK